jgi:hypothetical protein
VGFQARRHRRFTQQPLDAPRVARQTRRNGRRRLQGHVRATEIVRRHEQGKHERVILPFLAEGVREASKTAILHPNREVRTLYVARANLTGLRLPGVLIVLGTYYRGRAVPLLALPRG